MKKKQKPCNKELYPAELFRIEEFSRLASLNEVKHCYTGFTRNVKRTSASKKEKNTTRNRKIMREKPLLAGRLKDKSIDILIFGKTNTICKV